MAGASATASPTRTSLAATEIEGRFDVGGGKLFLSCRGSGSPTVISLHGAITERSVDPHRKGEEIQRRLSPEQRVCLDDRRILAHSDVVPGEQTPADAIGDLEGLLQAAEVKPPYVLLGASFGGMLAHLSLTEHPDQVQGMVLLDSPIPGEPSLDHLLPPDQRYIAVDREDRQSSLERSSHYRVHRSAARKAYVDRFEPGRLLEVDSPHFMEASIPGRIVDELRAVIRAGSSGRQRSAGPPPASSCAGGPHTVREALGPAGSMTHVRGSAPAGEEEPVTGPASSERGPVFAGARGRVVAAGDGPVSDWNIANVITIVRILLAPLFVWLLFADGHEGGPLRWLAAALFVVAIVTDSVDGNLARSRNLVTNLGILLDPIADKVLTGAALVGLSLLGELPWWVTGLILVREIGITVFRFAVLSDRVVPASRGGKLKTVLQAVAITAALLPLAQLLGTVGVVLDTVLMGAALVLTVVTGIDYLVQAYRRNR